MLKIQRIYQDDCTVGVLNWNGFRCFTLELPWLDNRTSVSCIPEGTYQCKKIVSPSLGECVDICDVVGRTFIRIHVGNYTSQIQGCILVGESLVDMNRDGIIDVSNSRKIFDELMKLLPDEFLVQIRG
ncbi:coil containing protein [Vibrio phage vB_VhaP_PG11]|nr:coil containing protein [Vibrio phage vB_VhaP_PG11]